MAKDKNAQLRNLSAGYGEAIRNSDFKAINTVLFVAIMMGVVLQFRDFYPWYLSVPVILTPFTIIFLNLLISVFPRFPRSGRPRFPIWRKLQPEDFDFLADAEAELEALPALCALFSRILWWKTVTLQTAYVLSMGCLAAAAILLFVGWLWPPAPTDAPVQPSRADQPSSIHFAVDVVLVIRPLDDVGRVGAQDLAAVADGARCVRAVV